MLVVQKAFVLVVLFTSVLGCSTPYQQKDIFGGFSETQLDTNVWRIRFSGNAFTGQDKVRDLSLLRACEIALSTGYSYVAVVSDRDQVKKNEAQIGSTSYSGTATCAGGTCSAIVNSYPPSKIPFTKYSSEQLVVFFTDRPEDFFVIDAMMSYRSLSAKYGVPTKSFRNAPKVNYSQGINRQAEQQRLAGGAQKTGQEVAVAKDDINYDVSDEALEQLAEKISALPMVASKTNISLARNGGYYLIYGQVENNLIKKSITEIVRSHPYVVRVYNETQAAIPVSSHQERLDRNTGLNILRDGELAFPQLRNRIKVYVSDGVVYLMGLLAKNEGEKIIEFASRYPDNNISRVSVVIEWSE